MLSMVKMLLKGEVGGCALNSHGKYIVDLGKSWKNHGIVFLNLCGNPVLHMQPASVLTSLHVNACMSEIKLLSWGLHLRMI